MSTLTACAIDRIKSNLGFPWRASSTRDRFKFGGSDTVVTGIATTMFDLYDAIRHAADTGCNMLIPHEDTYWNDADDLRIRQGPQLQSEGGLHAGAQSSETLSHPRSHGCA